MGIRKDDYIDRKYVIFAFIVGVGIIFAIRLFFLQVWSEDYKIAAEKNALRDVIIYPPRGLIYDRNGKLLIYNEAVFDLMVIPGEVKDLDTLALCELIGIDTIEFNKRFSKAKKYSTRKASFFEKQISKEQTAYLQEKLYRFKGFYFQPRTLRKYPDETGAHLLGYIGEVNQKHIDKDPYYEQGDYIGISGIEKSYEKELRGVKGIKKVMYDVFNREKGSFQEGKYDVPAENGKSLYTGIDLDIQKYGEQLMKNKRGGVVAIDPSTGEIIALISTPSYDPNLLVGRIRSKNYAILEQDPLKPLFNRALISTNPPGSTFKLVNALIGQQLGVLHPYTTYGCNMGFHYGSRTLGCHAHPSPLNLAQSIQNSCNAYYCNVFRSMIDYRKGISARDAYSEWRNFVLKMGLGVKYDTDLPFMRSGNIPSPEYFDKIYGRNHWSALTMISLSIGQGEILTTPLQLANLAAMIANRGYFYTPHLVRSVGNPNNVQKQFSKRNESGINREYFDVVIEGMLDAVEGGTAAMSKIDSITMCGKTGTAQNPHGENHSVFIAFAPQNNPKIAIAVFIENSGYGGTWAAPIASLMIEKYIRGYIKENRKPIEERMLAGNLL